MSTLNPKTPTTRICCLCKTEKPIEEFSRDRNKPSGYTHSCKLCRAKRHKAWALANPEKVKEINERNKDKRDAYYRSPERKAKYRRKLIERTFGIPYSQYEEMNEEQGGLCDICKQPETRDYTKYLSVDHDHDTGKVRSLLCSKCNSLLGMAKEDISILRSAIDYLTKHKC